MHELNAILEALYVVFLIKGTLLVRLCRTMSDMKGDCQHRSWHSLSNSLSLKMSRCNPPIPCSFVIVFRVMSRQKDKWKKRVPYCDVRAVSHSIHFICHFLYPAHFLHLKIVRQEVRKFATKIALRQNGVN